MIAAVFAMQGFGILTASLVSLVVLAAFKRSIYENQDNLDYVWRICIGLGAVPACVAIYFRLTIPETPRYKIEAKKELNTIELDEFNKTPELKEEVEEVEKPKASIKEFFKHFSKWKNGKVLLGTAGTWFVLDIAFYGINLNQGIIIEAIGFSGKLSDDVWKSLFNTSVGEQKSFRDLLHYLGKKNQLINFNKEI